MSKEEMLKEYIRKFSRDNNISEECAKDYQAVKAYAEYLQTKPDTKEDLSDVRIDCGC